MPTGMVERIARTLCRQDGHAENIKFEGRPMWQSYEETARAVAAEMREPTAKMVSEGESETDSYYSKDGDFGRGWRAAIDAALAGG